ncbi:alpha/beta-hydrolase [Ramaria rubella]|nr:alpha/beta-hydrolase [Ramaria rubella]
MAREISRLYRELAGLPVYTSAYFLKSSAGHSIVRATISIRDHLRNIKRTGTKHIISTGSDVIVTPSQDVSEIASVPSPSGRRVGVLREVSDGALKKRFVEVWLGDRLEAIKEVTKIHEDFHVNPEAKAPEADETATSEEKANKFNFLPDLGERLTGKTRPTLYIFRWTHQKYEGEFNGMHDDAEEHSQAAPTVLSLKPSLPENSSFVFGQAAFSPDEKHVFATGYEETVDGRRLGPFGCWNRPSSIFRLELPKEFSHDSGEVFVEAQRLTPPGISARSPRVTDAAPGDPYTTIWLSNPVGGAHASATTLNSLRSDEEKSRVLVGSISEPSSPGSFPGLYVGELPSRPFLSLDTRSKAVSHLITHSFWGSRQTILGIALSSSEVCDLTPGQNESWTVSGTDGINRLLATRSAVNSPNELLEARLQDLAPVLDWKIIDKPTLTVWARNKLDTLKSSIVPIPGRHPTEVITIQLAERNNLPLLTVPHGGPHSITTSEFNPGIAALALEGYVISLVNYTGSLGFGQKHVDALIGRAGELDVQDCYHSAKHLIKLGLAQEGPGKQFVQGGSHGGFLSAHLIGQYPEFFSATVMRNPVIATGEIASVSDIPDWAFAEFGEAFGPSSTITPSIFDKLQKASPITYIDAVQTPVLLLVGEVDRRVPPSQSRNYYYALKGRDKEVKMLIFPGNGHSLDNTVEAELVGWEAGRNWLARFSKR